jgi:Ras family protein A
VPIILVGNKKDLGNDIPTLRDLARSKQEPVKTEQGRAIAEQVNKQICSVFLYVILFHTHGI